MTPSITVVVPVYEGHDQMLACLRSVIRHAPGTATPFDLLVIDDASPDAAIAPALEALAVEARRAEPPIPIRLLHNPENLGFVGTVNRAFEQCSGDVVLLNADTVVTAGWLDRMVDAARGDDVATVTPLSNQGSICTLPLPVIDAFGLLDEVPRIDECASFVAAQSAWMRPEVITGVGFCMYVNRTAYDLCGPFDQEAYGRGYGEEVDFCLRAGRLGMRHLVEDATYVHHHGAVSFGEDAHDHRRDASRFLHKRFRWFRAANRQERRNDPLAVTFAALELGLADRDPSRTHVLHLLHGPPDNIGGTEKHLNALIDALVPDFDFSILYPVESGFVLATRWWSDQGVIEHRFLLPGSVRWVNQLEDSLAGEALATALDLFDVDVVHVQNLIGLSLTPLAVLGDFDGRVVCSIHDLFLTCPHHSLLYRDDQPCGLPEDRSVCARCLPETEDLPIEHLDHQRARVAELVGHVDHWIFASQSSADYFNRVYRLAPDAVTVIEHGTTIAAPRRGRPAPGLLLDEPLRLAFVGRGWPKKGLGVVNQLADALAHTSVEVHHFGELVGEASPHLHRHGTYDNELLGDLLDLAGIQVVLLPGSVPESFGLVMTEAILAGVPVIGTTFGALGERIRGQGVGWTVDPTDVDGLVELVTRLDANRWEIVRASNRATRTPVETVAQTAPRYGALYGGGTDEREDQG